MHYAVNPKDRGAWGSNSVCGKKKPLTTKVEKVTCKRCLNHVVWDDFVRYDLALMRPLVIKG